MRKLMRNFAIFALAFSGVAGVSALAEYCSITAGCGVHCWAEGPSVSCSGGYSWVRCNWYQSNGALGGSYYFSC